MLTRRLTLTHLTMTLALATTALGSARAHTPATAASATVRQEGPLRVVATFSILANMVEAIGGDAVQVSSLVGPDGDAHVYAPTPAAARALAQADLVVSNGLHFEGWLDRLTRASGYRGSVVVASQGVSPLRLEGHPDPHAWQDLHNGRRYVDNIRAALVTAHPRQADAINARAAHYDRELQQLDAQTRARLSAIPEDSRQVVTSHDAFGYFAQAYGIRFRAAQGWSTEREASAAQVARLIQQLKRQRVRAVFVENMSNPKLVERIAREAGAVLGGTLYADALSSSGQGADTYVRLFQHNVDQLIRALSADPMAPSTTPSSPPAAELNPR